MNDTIQLRPIERCLVKWYYEEGMTLDEISTILNDKKSPALLGRMLMWIEYKVGRYDQG